MRKKYLLFWAFALLIWSSVSIAAGDYAHFHFIGFSRDAKYLAFEEYGINDSLEDDTAYSAIYVVNVEKNRWAIEPFRSKIELAPFYKNGKYDADEIETRVRAKNRRRAARQLRRFRILDGNTGRQVVAHLINEYEFESPTGSVAPNDAEKSSANSDSNSSVDRNAAGNQNTAANVNISLPSKEKSESAPMNDYVTFLPQRVAFTKRGNALYRDGFYELEIKPVPVKQKNCDEHERDMFSFELTLKNERDQTRVLQKAGRVPKNRGCTDGYGIQEAFLYRNKLAIFIGIFTRGWEGENMRLMAVTGDLDE
ncbi:MAG TPA: DUF2259 domain-containing protein [Pyrinomonadaceae bacterium]|jgi:predicted secreted protein